MSRPAESHLNTALVARPGPRPEFPFRLANTTESFSTLLRKDRAILLENAIFDTEATLSLPIPESLRVDGDPGAYIVQSKDDLDGTFGESIRAAGAAIVSYIPNRALLVRASTAVAQELRTQDRVQAVIVYQPYFKLKPSLLSLVLNESVKDTWQSQAPGTAELELNVLIFPSALEEARAGLAGLHTRVLGEGSTPFGPVLTVRGPLSSVASLARVPAVQMLELSRIRRVAMDLGREASGIAGSSTAMWNYLGLTGTNVTVSVLDTGIDPVHPDLKGRVLFEDPAGGADPSGHGTHIAGVIAGNGASSMNVANAPGSSVPPVSFQFRGAAPAASLFSIPFGSNNAPQQLSVALQQSSTKGSIVNNSWGYSGDYDYDLAAVICDAAARDVSPSVPGPQPVLCVFAAGNDGDGSDNGMGGKPGSIQSPAVAKNVITVGALEKNRWITNETWTCSGDGSCQTNAPWLLSTDSTNQVACFSSRGNVGAGIEGFSGRCKPDLVAQGTFTIAARSSNWDKSAYYSATNSVFTRLTDANYGQVLSNLNESVGPIYRFESGTSVAAAEVSGGLALMQEFFARLGRTNSPAGMKALLINGARPVGAYAVGPGASTNYQGWGQFHLPTSIHKALTNQAAAGSSMFFYDQDPATALASGESLTRSFDVRYAARSLPLRVTLVWTDPPGNPVAAVKLVNDLDLVVTNLDTGEVYWGNDFPSGGRFSRRWEAGSESCHDVVNNVESVLLPGSLSGHYSVTVAGRAVHVNAVESSVAKIAQDYALVVSCGDGQVPDALSVEQVATVEASAVAAVTVLTNQFSTSSGDFGAVLWHERLGAGSPLLSSNSIPLGSSGTSLLAPGTSNQWHFYILTNSSLFTNAAIVTFLPPTLSPRGGQNDPTEQADIDLYVSGDPGLLALSPAAIVDAAKSIGRNGSESIVLSNVTAEVLFIAVKCESQTAADYGFMAVLSDSPFASTDSQGMTILRGFPSPAVIPGPGTTAMMCLASDPILTRRVFVTNSVLHAETRDLKGSLTHDNSTVVLNNFGTNAGQDFVYDDSGEGTIAGARTSDGPGSLASFGGSQGMGQWLLTTQSTNLFGTNALFSVGLEPQTDLAGGVGSSLAPGGCRSDFIGIAPGISNLMAMVTVVSGTGPILMQLLPVANDATNSPVLLVNGGEHGALSIDATASPPIHAGTYEVRLCNQGPDPAEFTLLCTTVVDQRPRPVFGYELSQPVALPDRAVTSSVISVTNLEYIESVDVGVRIEHPRISDLVLHLVSPSGQRVLLQENRGGASAEGEGGDTIMTNSTAVSWTGGPQAFTNMFETGQRSGSVSIDYDMYSLPDTMHVYYQDVLLFDSGLVSGPGTTNLTYGPGTATSIAIVMNQGGNPDTNTAWRYRVTSTRPVPVPLTFTENTNFASVPIKFAPQPLTNINYSVPGSSPPVGIFYLPEQSLDALVGESALGDWKLEIEDTRAGPPNAEPRLITWRINFHLQNTFPVPGGLTPGKAFTSLLGPNQVLWYYIDALSWASFATNRLISASMPVNLLFASTPPTAGTNASAVPLMLSSTAGSVVLQTNGVPPLVPGARYYLGLQNTNSSTVTCSLQVDFDVNDVIALENGAPLQASNQGPLKPMDYYSFIVSTNAARVQFEVNRPTENLTLFVHRGMPLPGPVWADFSSANAWTNDELIVIYDFSQPIPLTPGLWYISVLNSSPNPAEYTVLATEFPAYATNVVITESVVMNDSICVSWTSLPGVHYFVQAKGRLDDADWTTVSPTLTASDVLTSYCTPANAGFQYFRVCEGLVLTQPPLLISSVSWSPAGAILQWSAEPGRRFKVEWSPAIAPPEWSAFTNVISSADGEFRFVDDGSQSGGLGAARFYRLQSGL